MEMTPDHELLREFARTNSGDAFAELVQRHVNLVYSAALRQVNGDHHLARDIAQTVFTDLARKAAALARAENLAGWLYTSAHFAAAKAVRGETRRRDREEKFMREPANETAPDADWEKIRPALDDAMHELKPADREAILLRYFENRQFAEVGAKLGLKENAARMRVERALEKLRTAFTKRGITTVATLAAVISAHAVQTAPTNLVASLTTTSVAAAGTGAITFLKIMTATKIKLALSAIFVATAATAIVTQHHGLEKLHEQSVLLQQQLAQLQTEKADLANQLASIGDPKKLTDDQFNELLKLRGEVGVLRRQTGEVAQTREATDAANQRAAAAEQDFSYATSSVAQFAGHQSALVNAVKQLGLAMQVFSTSHDNQFPTDFDQLTNELGNGFYINGKATNMFTINGIDLGTIELVNAGVPRPAPPNMIELRERLARQSPNGIWYRVYGFADGSVQIASSNDGNFDTWEAANTMPPPPAR